MNYEYIRRIYPEYISKGQLIKILRVSPKTALYLLEEGIINSVDTGQVTWKYKIKLDDVIDYMNERDVVGSKIPPGAVSSRHNRKTSKRKAYADLVDIGKEYEIVEYFKYIYEDYPELLSVRDIIEMTGIA